MKSLNTLEKDLSEEASVRCEASGLKCQLDHFQTVFMTVLWNLISERFNSTNKQL